MKKTILIFSAFYFPGELGGGPIRSILNIVNHLGDLFNFKIVTSDRDYKGKIKYQNVAPDTWNSIHKSEAFYLSPRNISIFKIYKILKNTDYNLLYLNSFFDIYFSIIPLIIHKFVIKSRMPVILAPRGEFSLGALSQKKYKKLFYIRVARLLNLYEGVYFQATTRYELNDIKKSIESDESFIKVVSDLSEEITPHHHHEKSILSPYLSICFLSRIVPIKNLEFAINVISLLNIPVKFDIFGPIEDEHYWNNCSKLITRLPSNIDVKYCGAINNSDISSVLPLYDVFFVPSKGENYGHVFVEAWSCGLPVLVSNNTPWKELADLGIGWDFSLSEINKFASALIDIYNWTDEKRFEVRTRCIQYARRIVNDPETVKANIELFSNILENEVDPFQSNSNSIPRGAAYHESLAEQWTDKYKSGGFARRIKRFHEFIRKEVKSGNLWLDAGCGSGILSNEIASFGAQVIAVDASPQMIQAASETLYPARERLTFQTIESIESLSFSNATFDGCLCSSVLEYVDDPGQALSEISRVLKNDGHVFLSVANRKSLVRALQKFVRNLCSLTGVDKFGYLDYSVNTYDKHEFAHELERRGFRVESSGYFDPVLPDIPFLRSYFSLIVYHAIKIQPHS